MVGDVAGGYLVTEVFRRAADATEATMLVVRFRELLLEDGATVARALGRRDWGVVVGSPACGARGPLRGSAFSGKGRPSVEGLRRSRPFR
jgi:hypothetical protein